MVSCYKFIISARSYHNALGKYTLCEHNAVGLYVFVLYEYDCTLSITHHWITPPITLTWKVPDRSVSSSCMILGSPPGGSLTWSSYWSRLKRSFYKRQQYKFTAQILRYESHIIEIKRTFLTLKVWDLTPGQKPAGAEYIILHYKILKN